MFSFHSFAVTVRSIGRGHSLFYLSFWCFNKALCSSMAAVFDWWNKDISCTIIKALSGYWMECLQGCLCINLQIPQRNYLFSDISQMYKITESQKFGTNKYHYASAVLPLFRFYPFSCPKKLCSLLQLYINRKGSKTHQDMILFAANNTCLLQKV